ncbi:MAG: hypothetical protein ACRAVC_02720 [Trichormus sp.]
MPYHKTNARALLITHYSLLITYYFFQSIAVPHKHRVCCKSVNDYQGYSPLEIGFIRQGIDEQDQELL